MKSKATKTVATNIECRDCGKVNGPEARDCGHCGAHLYMNCRKCGSRNPRVQIRCSNCGHRLHRSSHHVRLHSDSKFKLLLVVVVLVALYFVVRWLAAPPGFPALPPAEPMP
jgi:ribosomal protein L40E